MNSQVESGLSLYIYAFTHLLIDCTCAFTIYNGAIIHRISPPTAILFIVMYDILAFALQPVIGIIVDRIRCSRFVLLSGILLTIAGALLVFVNALSGCIFTGFGNALFHIGAGSQVLNRYPSTTSQAGIFVGPGAIGLSIGFWFGTKGIFPIWYLISALSVALLICALLPPLYNTIIKPSKQQNQAPALWFVIIFLLLSIAFRGFAGKSGFTGLSPGAFVTIGLGVATCCGKIAGGIIADRLGWITTATTALVLSSIGILFIHNGTWIVFTTMFLFQMTMPITLLATSQSIPGRPAFAFGLTCLALIFGTFASYFVPESFCKLPVTLSVVCISCILIITALWKLRLMSQMTTTT
jgi:MFS transporter, FSR family, fosmidomycin resistance protein